jgi:hypothetical protein
MSHVALHVLGLIQDDCGTSPTECAALLDMAAQLSWHDSVIDSHNAHRHGTHREGPNDIVTRDMQACVQMMSQRLWCCGAACRREVERRTHPLSRADFELLESELEAWRQSQTDAIKAAGLVPQEEQVRQHHSKCQTVFEFQRSGQNSTNNEEPAWPPHPHPNFPSTGWHLSFGLVCLLWNYGSMAQLLTTAVGPRPRSTQHPALTHKTPCASGCACRRPYSCCWPRRRACYRRWTGCAQLHTRSDAHLGGRRPLGPWHSLRHGPCATAKRYGPLKACAHVVCVQR